MPRSGGEADKLDNQFEGVWTVNAILDIFEGRYQSICVEALGDESVGVEFHLTTNNGAYQFHSSKRQKTGGDWSIAKLCKKRPITSCARQYCGVDGTHQIAHHAH